MASSEGRGDNPTTGGPDDGKEGGHRAPGGPLVGEKPSDDSQNPQPGPRHGQ